ncbi:MAG: alcohol dehydrogenase catalytic domain-containing protein, partial [Rhizobacter sp.]
MPSRAIQIRRHGGPEVLEEVSVPLAAPGPREVTVRQSAIGLNFADIYQRRGSAGPHAAATFPLILGAHGAGTIEALGADVTGWQLGQSVAYIHPGAYQAVRNVPASRLVALPSTISQEVAGAQLLRGLTAEYLLRRLHRVRPGEAVLVHAAAGGMGQLLAEWARSLGATVIGTVGSPEKADVARAHGCHHVFDYRRDNFARTCTVTASRMTPSTGR